MPINRTQQAAQQGFSMVIIAALFTAFATLAALTIDRGSISKQFSQQAMARAQMARLSSAITKYYVLNNKYPCPARFDLATSNASFGMQESSTSTGSTTDCATGLAGSGIYTLTGSTEVIEGMVPITTLSFYGADLADAFDPWGSRVMYVVNRQLTPSGSGATTRPTVTEGITGRTINPPDFMLLSFGPDKMGAIPKSGTAVIIPCAASTDIRSENCDADLNFVYRPIYTAPNATVTGTYKRYDDVIGFYAAQ